MAGTSCKWRRTLGHHGLALLLSLALLWGPASASITFYLTYTGQEAAALDCVAAAGGSVTHNIPQDNIILGACPDDACYQRVALCGSSILDTTGVVMERSNIMVAGPELDSTLQAQAAPAAGSPASPPFAPGQATLRCWQWSPDAINAPAAWAAGWTGAGVRIAILDEPLHCAHQDIGYGNFASLVDIAAGASFVSCPSDICDKCPGAPDPDCVLPCQRLLSAQHSHGTVVAGIAAGRGLVTVGIAPRATIIPIAVRDPDGIGTWDAIIAGIYHAVNTSKADILNINLGAAFTKADAKALGKQAVRDLWAPLVRAVNFAHRSGALVVVSTGDAVVQNEAGNGVQSLTAPSSPDQSGRDLLASLPNTISVSATGPPGSWCPLLECVKDVVFGCNNNGPQRTQLPHPASDMRIPAFYTNFATKVDLAAPGGTYQGIPGPLYDWLSTMIMAPVCSSGIYKYVAGTSLAAPHVSGVAALLLEKFPDLRGKPDKLKARLLQGAAPNKQYKHYYGKGFLDAAASLA
jgi:subtilisin family serine protease